MLQMASTMQKQFILNFFMIAYVHSLQWFIYMIYLLPGYLVPCMFYYFQLMQMSAIWVVSFLKLHFADRLMWLQDLIHGAPIGKPAANRASVTAVYVADDGTKIHFSRIIHGSTSDYKIDGKVWI